MYLNSNHSQPISFTEHLEAVEFSESELQYTAGFELVYN